jgi:multicomponent Na+:H+ antiporter subunit C
MEILMCALIGVLMSVSVWLMLSRNLVKFLFGLVLISNVANLIIFTVGGLTVGAPPLIADDGAAVYANSLPQALVLTAIVIGFGLVSFTLILALRAYQSLGTVNVDEMVLAERPHAVEYASTPSDRPSVQSVASQQASDHTDHKSAPPANVSGQKPRGAAT